ncbi:threonine--tRNA ligase [Candidatus Woesearchaeota archaeon]|nr:threonine--tRNA ligase [Candidatus Woesearchaeota archaeon]|tara:strand:- start:15081 stop:17000 length:1920 start_codon:yes stop_codon:yes gene_type:complete
MPKIKITLPDGSSKRVEKGVTAAEIASSIGKRLAQDALAIEINGKLTDLSAKIDNDSKIRIITYKDKEGKGVFWHSASHLMTQAVLRLFKGQNIGLGVGMPIDIGYYQDYDIKNLTEDDLKKIEKEMEKIVQEHLKISQKNIAKKEAYAFYKKDPYKTQFINEVQGNKVSMYTQGEFNNLCKGPHVPNTSYIKAFKLTKIAGAYWKGDSKNKMLTRIYGVAFPEKKQLKDYLELIKEAEKRDHRRIGQAMDLFSFHEEAPGMPFFHDKGQFIWQTLVDYTVELMKKRGYEINMTPMILSKNLWVQSGHWDHFKDNMYFTKIDDKESAVKPMNCPGNILIYKTKSHSYRELPIKAGEFGLVHRHELSGVLAGLFRVRCFTQDDAHIFCTEEQIEEQVKELLDFVDELYGTFGFDYNLELSTKPEKAMGDPNLWKLAEEKLGSVLDKSKKKYKLNEGDGAFYGPKIDFHVKDAIGRTWQCATIQLDFQMPEKFDLTYEGKDGRKHRPVMLHRTILGAVERFMGILIEHYAGKFPLWIAPEQVRIITVSDKFNKYADKIMDELKLQGIRVELDKRTESIPRKVREAQIQHVPLILTVGEKEVKNNTVAVRTLDNKVHFNIKITDLIKKILKNIENKKEKFSV